MRPTRNTYQNGWIETRPSKKDGLVFVYRWRERKPSGGYRKRTELIGPVSVLKTEANARRAIEQRKLEINSEDSKRETVTMNSVINRYLEEELPEVRHSTADAYRSYLANHIQPRWGSHSIAKIKPLGVELWLKQLTLAPKTKGHFLNLLRVLFNCAMRWEIVDIAANPMKLVLVRGGSKRMKEPRILTIPQIQNLIKELDDPYRMMVILDLATGLLCIPKTCPWRITELHQKSGVFEVLISCQDARCPHPFHSFDRHSRPASTAERPPFGRCRVHARQASTTYPQSWPQACSQPARH
jgi:integrase